MTRHPHPTSPKAAASSSTAPRPLTAAGFSEPEAAQQRLETIALECGAELRATVEHVLATHGGLIADPDAALLFLERLLLRHSRPEALPADALGGRRRLQNVLAVLGGSRYLAEILLRRPQWLDDVARLHVTTRRRSSREIEREIRETTALASPWATAGEPAALEDPLAREESDEILASLQRVRQKEMLRIGASDLLALFDTPTLTREISALADALVRATLELAWRTLDDRPQPGGFCALALGKLGGSELNYSSDIDLVFVSRDNAPSYWPLARRLVDLLGRPTAEGFLYRVDLRLRPWGRDGAVVTGVPTYVEYVAENARAGEIQALVKARPIAGDLALGRELLERIASTLYTSREAEPLRRRVRALKESIEAYHRHRGDLDGQVKAGEGSIRDVEFTTQYLQLLHAPSRPDADGLRSPNTLEALDALRSAGALSEAHYRTLVEGYVFLRTVEHDLQLASNLPLHRLPHEPKRLRHLASRLGFHDHGDVHSRPATERFLERCDEHARAVRSVFEQHLEPPRPQPPDEPAAAPAPVRMPSSYAAFFTPDDIAGHQRKFAQLRDERPVAIEWTRTGERRYRVEIVAYDALGSLSVVCGLLYAYGFNIVDGEIFSSEDDAGAADDERRLVDLFTVETGDPDPTDRFEQLAADLLRLLVLLRREGTAQAQLELAKIVSLALRRLPNDSRAPLLYPLDIEIDNERSDRYTVLRIDGTDTPGFLYELTNALALAEIDVGLMEVRTSGRRVRDTLWVTSAAGEKITDPERIRRLEVTVVLIKHFTQLLPGAPNAEQALHHFREYLGDLFSREEWQHEITALEQPAVLSSLAQLLGQSDFLWHDFLRMQHESLFPVVRDLHGLDHARPRAELERTLEEAVSEAADAAGRRRALREFKDREMFRIDMRKILRRSAPFEQFSKELTELAEIVCGKAQHEAWLALENEHGPPLDERGEPVPYAVLALGKFGGRELGFASDLELMLCYRGRGATARTSLEASAFFRRLIEEMRSIVGARRQGTFDIDLRLRPYGEGGPTAVSLEAFAEYFSPQGDAWPYERQALVKLRALLGDARFGAEIERLRDELVYERGRPDIEAARAFRERQIRHLVTPGTINAKFSRGALVDVEYLVQLLQIGYGRERPSLRNTNTAATLGELHAVGVLDAHDYDVLAGAYRFWRQVIDGLRMVRGHAKDLTVPARDNEEFSFLARRLLGTSEQLQTELSRHLEAVPRIQSRLTEQLRRALDGRRLNDAE